MGWQQNIFPLIIINSSGQFTGLFVYSPAPGAGNLIASIAGSSGTDPYGNAYQKGVVSYAASGAVTVINGATTLVYAGTPAVGNLLASIAPATTTDAPGNTVQAGVTSYNTSTGALTVINGASTLVYAGIPAGGVNDNLIASIAPANTTDTPGNTVQKGLAVYQTQGGVGLTGTIQIVGNIIQWIAAVSGDKLSLSPFINLTVQNLFIQAAGSATLPALVNISNPASLSSPEGWHTFTLTGSTTAGTDINGTTYSPAYRMNADGMLLLRGIVVAGAGGLASGTTWATIPGAYAPATNIPGALVANVAGAVFTHVYVRPNGNMQFNSALGAGTSIWLDCIIPVNGT